MIEKVLLDYLSEEMDVPVFMELQDGEEPEQYITIQKSGGSLDNHVGATTFYIQSNAPSLFAASLLNERVKETLLNGDVNGMVYGVKLIADFNASDTVSKQYRYHSTFTLYHNERV